MGTSTIPAFTAALISTLAARPNLTNTVISDGPPDPGAVDREFIAVGDIRGNQRAAAIGAQSREEEYFVAMTIWVKQGNDQTTADSRAFAIMAEIENALRADASVGHVVRWAQVEGGISLHKSDVNSGSERVATLTFEIWVRARI